MLKDLGNSQTIRITFVGPSWSSDVHTSLEHFQHVPFYLSTWKNTSNRITCVQESAISFSLAIKYSKHLQKTLHQRILFYRLLLICKTSSEVFAHPFHIPQTKASFWPSIFQCILYSLNFYRSVSLSTILLAEICLRYLSYFNQNKS